MVSDNGTQNKETKMINPEVSVDPTLSHRF